MIKGLFETHLHVKNLERSVAFYAKTLKLQQCYYEKKRRAAFFWIGKEKQAMLGLWEKQQAVIDIRHFAFECEADWVINESVEYLKKRNITCRNFLNDGTERPMVFAWMPAVSIYFDDPDGHSLEFIGMLKGESKPKRGIISYDKWLKINR